jgi:hypothetical protein
VPNVSVLLLSLVRLEGAHIRHPTLLLPPCFCVSSSSVALLLCRLCFCSCAAFLAFVLVVIVSAFVFPPTTGFVLGSSLFVNLRLYFPPLS